MKMQGVAGRMRGLWIVLVVLAGVLSNLATTRAVECDSNGPYEFSFTGDGQTGAATAPLGSSVAVKVTCRADTGGSIPLEASDELTQWTVLTGGGLVDGRAATTKRTGYDGRAGVLWQLGGTLGEQTATVRVRDRQFTFKATAGGPTANGTCTGGAGTDFDPLHERAIDGDETWPLAGSPYRGGRVIVGTGATLTIAPGVTVCVSELSVFGNGQLHAEGTVTQPIQIAPSQTGGYWMANFLRTIEANPNGQRQSVLRHVNASGLASLQVFESALLIEDSTLLAHAGLGFCPAIGWRLPARAPAADSAVRRSVIDGFGGRVGCFGEPAAVTFEAPAAVATTPLPFQARVLRAPVDAVRLTGLATEAVALSNCEIAGAGRDALVIDHTGVGSPRPVSGCNFTGNARFALRNARAGSVNVDARGNWWGDPAGAPTAGGNAVSGGVDAASPAAVPFVLGY